MSERWAVRWCARQRPAADLQTPLTAVEGQSCSESCTWHAWSSNRCYPALLPGRSVACMFEDDFGFADWRHTHTADTTPHMDGVRSSAFVVG